VNFIGAVLCLFLGHKHHRQSWIVDHGGLYGKRYCTRCRRMVKIRAEVEARMKEEE
jgi:hypothetical protein